MSRIAGVMKKLEHKLKRVARNRSLNRQPLIVLPLGNNRDKNRGITPNSMNDRI